MQQTTMTAQQVADRYYELAQQSKQIEIQAELYAQNTVSIEPEHAAAMGMAVVTTGMDAIRAKGKARREITETVHGSSCSVPVVGGKFFSVALGRDITLKGRPRMSLEEIAVFEVKDGKIISEQFFY